MQEIYLAGGCLWGVQEYLRHLPGVIFTEVGRANGTTQTLDGDYDGYTECVKTHFDPSIISLDMLITRYFEIIDPYSINKQGIDEGEKYRTGIYSKQAEHLVVAKQFINSREDSVKIAVEILPLSNYIKSAEEHQDRLQHYPDDYCHIPPATLHKYKQ
ncbi:peptide-methionine (S)-S-oxide reductase [Psychromonas sp. KJ10-2]|uniref:peptide-methionine (S)-S-oxide reductase n=1 Tax=Psychromonas sp. KJ10-2 TaxID=3391822 RepID=UPI0039B55CE8